MLKIEVDLKLQILILLQKQSVEEGYHMIWDKITILMHIQPKTDKKCKIWLHKIKEWMICIKTN